MLTKFNLGSYFTFELSKSKPIYNWFYYKEAYSPEFVEYVLDEFEIKQGNILDMFLGIGTTAMVAKARGLQAYGIDASPLAVFAARVKTRNYSENDIFIVQKFMKNIFQKKSLPNLRWEFELFKIEKAFPPANLRDILFIREKISEIKNENAHNLLLLALISIIPMCSFVLKDGGVLKITKKSVAPVKEMFKHKVKRILFDLENRIIGLEPQIYLGDARLLPFENKSINTIITSPPYLNNIDYTKIYGLELSLLEINIQNTKETRERCIRSFITSNACRCKIPPEIENIGYRIPIVGTYFSDMEKVLKESFRIMKPGAIASFVVGNSVIHETHILVDEILAEIGARIGFECEIWVGSERIADVKFKTIKTRESAIILRKS